MWWPGRCSESRWRRGTRSALSLSRAWAHSGFPKSLRPMGQRWNSAMPRKPKPRAPGAAPDTEAMIRVDHAGEYGAVRIYEGQLAVLKGRASADTIRHMAEQ